MSKKRITDKEINETLHWVLLDKLLDEMGAPKQVGRGTLSPFGRLQRLRNSSLEDKARLDWLEKSEESCLCWNVDGKVNNGWTIGDIFDGTESNGTESNGTTLREAIDAARAEGGKTQ